MQRQGRINAILVCIIIFLAALSGWFYAKMVDLESKNTELSSQIDALEKPQLHLISFSWSDNPYGGDIRLVIASEIIFNSGTLKAYGVDIRIKVYDSQNNTLGNEIFYIGAILGKSYASFSDLHTLYHTSAFGFAHHVEAELHFSGYG